MKKKTDESKYFDEYLKELQDNQTATVWKDDVYKKLSKKQLQTLVYTNTYNKLENILLKLFKWHVPPTFNARAIELGFIHRGWMCAFNGPLGAFCLPCTPNNRYNVYGDPIQVRAFGFNGTQFLINVIYPYESPMPAGVTTINQDAENIGVFARDNDMSYPYIQYVKEYAYRLTDYIIALHIATQRLKNPWTYAVDEKELKDTIEKLVEKIESNDDVIIRKRNINLNTGQDTVQLEPNPMRPDIVTHIREVINFTFSQFLETIGINTNPSPDKAEVVLTPEIDANNSVIDLLKDVRFMNRQKFCEQINLMLGIPIAVEMNVNDAQQLAERTRREMLGEGGFGNDTSGK